MTRLEKIREVIDDMNTAELVTLHNNYCERDGRYFDCVFNMTDFNECMSECKPWEVAQKTYYGNFCPAHDYWWYNAYGNVDSADFDPDIISPADIAAYIDANNDSLYNDDIAAILDDNNDE